jgi:hypothetical protein
MIFVISLFGTMWLALVAVFWTKKVLTCERPDGEDWAIGVFWSIIVNVILVLIGFGGIAMYQSETLFPVLMGIGGGLCGLFLIIFPVAKYERSINAATR